MTFDQYFGNDVLLSGCSDNEILESGFTAFCTAYAILESWESIGIIVDDEKVAEMGGTAGQRGALSEHMAGCGSALLLRYRWMIAIPSPKLPFVVNLDPAKFTLGEFRHFRAALMPAIAREAWGRSDWDLEDYDDPRPLQRMTHAELTRQMTYFSSSSMWNAESHIDSLAAGDKIAVQKVCYFPASARLWIQMLDTSFYLDVCEKSGFTIGRLRHLLKSLGLMK